MEYLDLSDVLITTDQNGRKVPIEDDYEIALAIA
jgi:hypothetical protein